MLDRTFESFDVGDFVRFSRRFGKADFQAFAALSHDRNPLHWDERYAAGTSFEKPIVPLHLAALPFSAIAGMLFPGHRALIVRSKLRPIKPIPYDSDIRYSARIVEKSESRSLLVLRVIAFRDRDVLLEGELVVRVRDDGDCTLVPSGGTEIATIERGGRNRTALITGATGSIGRAVARQLATAGWDLLIHCRRESGAAHDLARVVREIGQSAAVVEADLLDPAATQTLASAAAGVAAVVHCASPPVRAALNQHMQVTYQALRQVAEAVLPGLLERQDGHLLFLGSSAVHHDSGDWADYVAAKNAAGGYVTGLDRAYSPYGVFGKIVAPGFVATSFSQGLRPVTTPALLPEEVAEVVGAALADAENRQPYWWIEPGSRKRGRYGFHRGEAAARTGQLTSIDLARESAAADVTSHAHHTPRLETIIRNFFRLPDNASLTDGGLDVTPGWDSFSHIELILELEQRLGLNFASSEIDQTTRYADLIHLVTTKLASRRAEPGV